MDGGESIEYQHGDTAVMTEVVVTPMETVSTTDGDGEDPNPQVLVIGQPQVIVENIMPDDVIEEDHGEEEVLTAGAAENGTEETSTATALNDIIADAVDGEEDVHNNSSTNNNNNTAEDVVLEEGEEEVVDPPETTTETPPPSRVKQEENLDLNQCRCCTSRTDLQDIFEPLKRETGLPISSVITKLCTGVTITKRDHLPNVVCKECVYKLQIAWEIKELCERTDKELRQSLPRSKKVSRRRDYTLIDYESSSGEDAGANDDEDEFKLSDELEEGSDASDSDVDYDEAVPKKRGRPKKNQVQPKATPSPSVGATPRPRGRPRKNASVTPAASSKAKTARATIVYVTPKREATSDEDEEDDDDEDDDFDAEEEEDVKPAKVARRQCPKCKAVVLGGAAHVCKANVAFSCTFCSEKFTTHPLYMNHQQLHTNFQNANTCVRCHKQYPDKGQLRKHQSGVRCHKATRNDCYTCGRVLANASQLAIHLRTKCLPATKKLSPGGGGGSMVKREVKKEVVTPKKEQNLFKCVAPPTSTYWSDSFSE